MAALVQSFPQQSGTITMLQTRPSSASGMLQPTAQGQAHHQYQPSPSQMQMHGYRVGGNAPTTYRGQTIMGPGAHYAYAAPQPLPYNNFHPQQNPYLRPDQRTYSAPVFASSNAAGMNQGGHRARYPAPASVSTSSTSSSDLSAGINPNFSRDDSAIPSAAWQPNRGPRPQSTLGINSTAPVALGPGPTTPVRPSPERYRRPGQRRADTLSSLPSQQAGFASQISPTGTGNTSPGSLSAHASRPGSSQGASSTTTVTNVARLETEFPVHGAVDDFYLKRPTHEASRYRRRSIHTIDLGNQFDAQLRDIVGPPPLQQDHQHPLRSSPVNPRRPSSSPSRSATVDVIAHNTAIEQAASGPAPKREPTLPTAPVNPAPIQPAGAQDASNLKHDQIRSVNIPPRASSTDAAKRVASPSPLSKPMTMPAESPASKGSFASTVNAALQAPTKANPAAAPQNDLPQSPAAKQLALVSEKENKKSKSSRLRRAFSFGSAAELRKAAAENNETSKSSSGEGCERARLRKERYQNEHEAEHARIAQQQEAGGIGQGIYSGQGNIFNGSTDNLSISSTASSASIMIRKMGQGMKKGTRSLVGLFRPKSVIGVPAMEPVITQASQAQVSMINVEAERDIVNVNAHVKDQAGGGTGFPKLERNSVDAAAKAPSFTHERTGSAESNNTPRKSIMGGERERAEVLAAVKKGILKRSATDSPNGSPVVRPADNRTPSFNLPAIPQVSDTPNSSGPSTPTDEHYGHKRTNSVNVAGDDYFMSPPRFRGASKSVPNTPPGTVKRNATFSPRIIFHDTWPSTDYDRRGEIATCNRLTPMLAQQIKEELNSFKMEMEVHENSKIYTHFF